MFSFHKPKVYRSSTGCCICKAKSSSSRFTDSKKYEEDFIECFQLLERRTGEICNACVLLVKRWKKLPAGSDRNWSHVVDARAGPGIKSLTKFKSKNKKKLKETQDKLEKIVKKKHVYLKPDREREQSPAMSDDYNEDFLPRNAGVEGEGVEAGEAEEGSKNSSRAGSPAGSDDGLTTVKRLSPEQGESGIKRRLPQLPVSGFIDMTYFKREKICCGTIFKGPYGEVMIDPSLLKPCIGCIARGERQRQVNAARNSPSHSSASASPSHSSASASPSHSLDSAVESTVQKPISKSFSDSSSDSGYDESSNQGVGESKLAKIIKNSASAASTLTLTTSTIITKQDIKTTIIPIKSVQLKAIPIPVVAESIRLNSTDLPIKLVPLKQVEQILYKPITLAAASPAIVKTTNNNTNLNLNSSSHHQNQINIVSNPLVDFAIHASARQSIANN